MKSSLVLMESPRTRRRRAVGFTLLTIALVAGLLLFALPRHHTDNQSHAGLDGGAFVIDAQAGPTPAMLDDRSSFLPPEPLKEQAEIAPTIKIATAGSAEVEPARDQTPPTKPVAEPVAEPAPETVAETTVETPVETAAGIVADDAAQATDNAIEAASGQTLDVLADDVDPPAESAAAKNDLPEAAHPVQFCVVNLPADSFPTKTLDELDGVKALAPLGFAAEEPDHSEPETPAYDPSLVSDEGGAEAFAQALLTMRAKPPVVQEGAIASGQTASALLCELLSPGEIHELAQDCKEVFSLTRLRVGQPYALTSHAGKFVKLEYEINADERLVVTRDCDCFKAEIEAIHYDVELKRIAGSVDSNLFLAVTSTGEGPELAMKLADIFGWEVDFIRDIRAGDRFKALVEKRYRKGEFAGYGRVLAAEFTNQGKDFQGFLYQDHDGVSGYFDAAGNSLKRAFLKAPLSFTRISSGFTMKRFHPVLHKYRAHPAIDYAAPTGTPVMTVGDGRVIGKGWDNGGGNYVKIRHGNGYETTYMHLSRFARGVAKGKWVSQGDVIAYVGATGLATGPHLDFRMKRHGQYVNPTHIENPRADALGKDELPAFLTIVQERLPMLEGVLAQYEPNRRDDSL